MVACREFDGLGEAVASPVGIEVGASGEGLAEAAVVGMLEPPHPGRAVTKVKKNKGRTASFLCNWNLMSRS